MTERKDHGSPFKFGPDGGPAFPTDFGARPGMPLRDWFAGQALPAIISGQFRGTEISNQLPASPEEDVATASYEIADAMLKVRENG